MSIGLACTGNLPLLQMTLNIMAQGAALSKRSGISSPAMQRRGCLSSARMLRSLHAPAASGCLRGCRAVLECACLRRPAACLVMRWPFLELRCSGQNWRRIPSVWICFRCFLADCLCNDLSLCMLGLLPSLGSCRDRCMLLMQVASLSWSGL